MGNESLLSGAPPGVRWLPDLLADIPHPRVLEIGSRHVTPAAWPRPEHWDVLGIDLHEGPGVDLVADAHELSHKVGRGGFDAVYSHAVFEHLLLPWKVALEMNRVLVPGGIAWIVTHEAFPVHEEPWDFWRFGTATWEQLFRRTTGFEVLGQRPLHPATVRPRVLGLLPFRGHAGCEVQVRKIGEPDPALRWDAALADVLPAGHRYARPPALPARAVRAARRRLGTLLPQRPSPADPWNLAAQPGRWTVLAGPDARPVDLPGGPPRHLEIDGPDEHVLRGALRELPSSSVRDLALLDLLHRDARPWSLVREIHRVLSPGGRVWIDTVHTAPAGFGGWRLSSEALLGLFPPCAGFRLERRAMLDPCLVLPDGEPGAHPAPAYLRVLGLARKVGPWDEERLVWD